MALPSPFPIYPPQPALLQPREGYRYSIDSLLLASFAAPRPGDRVVDLGAGCGVVSVVLARRFPGIELVAVELQEELCRWARENRRRHGLQGRMEVICGDIGRYRQLFPAGAFDYAVSNPPFRPVGNGRLCPHPGEALARHEIAMDLATLMAAAAYLLRPGGRLAVVYAAERLARLVWTMEEAGLEPKRMAPVYPRQGARARLVLVEGCRNGGEELRLEPPVFLDRVVEVKEVKEEVEP